MILFGQQNKGQQINYLPLQPKILLLQPNVELNLLLLLQNIFAVPILTNDFVGITKPFFFRARRIVAQPGTGNLN